MKFGVQNIPSVPGPYKDSETNVRVLFLQITDATDLQEVEWINGPGEDSAPQIGSKILIVEIGRDYKLGIACDDGIEPEALDGEKILYSLDPTGAQVGYIKLSINPVSPVELNGNADNAVRYSELETAFNDLQQKYNDLLTQYLSHTHVAPTGATGPPVLTSPPPEPSTAQIILAKVLEVLLP